MKKIAIIFAAMAVLLGSCSDDSFIYNKGDKSGILSFDDFSIAVNDEIRTVTKATTEAPGEYTLVLKDSDGKTVWEKKYSDVKAEIAANNKGGLSLKAGNYSLTITSISGAVPAAVFDAPVYGCTKQFTIEVGKTCNLGEVVCTLVQCGVQVRYNDDFLAMVTGDGVCTVEVTAGSPLDFNLKCNNGSAPNVDSRTGYFAVNNGTNTTMAVTFKGSLEGKNQKMKTSITGINPQELHIITFMKKLDETGTASFVIIIDGLLTDTELVSDIKGVEEGDGFDPKAPAGDGGIELVCSAYDLSQNIVVPAGDGVAFPLKMQALVPNGTKKFTVDISSTNDDFMRSLSTVGGSKLDLINPSADAMGIFDIVPFPHGSELLNATTIDFDLSGAQGPLLAFPGVHTFKMNVTDNKGCKNSIDVILEVK